MALVAVVLWPFVSPSNRMYPFYNAAARPALALSDAERFVQRTVKKEIRLTCLIRNNLKDTTTSGKLRIKGDKAADLEKENQLRVLRKQLKALPQQVVEHAHTSWTHEQEVKRRNLQDFQCMLMCKLHKVLMANFVEQGLDPKTYRIGGNDRRSFERFYRVEPSMSMSKPQFITAMRRCFGDHVLKAEASFGKLFESFDFESVGRIDWRAFLYMLLILMQADMPYVDHLKYAFALYASEGILDVDTPSKVTLGTLKDLVCVPVLPVQRKHIRDELDACWLQLAGLNDEVHALTIECVGAGLPGGADNVKVSLAHLQLLVRDTSFAVYCQQHNQPWTFTMEEHFFHPMFLSYLRDLRKAFRDERECERFILMKNVRQKKYAYQNWKAYIARRDLIRWRFMRWHTRWKLAFFARCFDQWKKVTLENEFGIQMQRCARGFLARARKKLTIKLIQRTMSVQAGARQLMTRQRYKQSAARQDWAANMIQKLYRGRMGRVRVSGVIASYYDTGKRMMEKRMREWQHYRANKATWRILMCYRKHTLKKRLKARLAMKDTVEALGRSMEAMLNQARIKKEVYRQNLAKFYADRKREFDETIMLDKLSRAEQSKIRAMRRRKREEGQREADARLKQEMEDRENDIRAAAFNIKWEKIREERCAARLQKMKHLLESQNSWLSPDERIAKKKLTARIQKHLVIVLRRADDARIPMEIPEGTEIATDEILLMEVEAEKELVHADMLLDGQRIEGELKEIKRKEIEQLYFVNLRRHEWASRTIAGAWHVYTAREMLRKKAQKVYKKHWDKAHLEYYYEDQRTRATVWTKPKSLGPFDVNPAPGWCTMTDNEGDLYFYNPLTWEMTWHQPALTTMCTECGTDFAVSRITAEPNALRCEDCFNRRALAMLEAGVTGVELRFKTFNGSIPMNPVFAIIKEKTWAAHVLERDLSLRDQVRVLPEIGRISQREINMRHTAFALTALHRSRRWRTRSNGWPTWKPPPSRPNSWWKATAGRYTASIARPNWPPTCAKYARRISARRAATSSTQSPRGAPTPSQSWRRSTSAAARASRMPRQSAAAARRRSAVRDRGHQGIRGQTRATATAAGAAAAEKRSPTSAPTIWPGYLPMPWGSRFRPQPRALALVLPRALALPKPLAVVTSRRPTCLRKALQTALCRLRSLPSRLLSPQTAECRRNEHDF